MMKIFKALSLPVFTALLLFTLIACKESPKSLAKQSFNLYMEAMDAMYDEERTKQVNEKANVLFARIEKLSKVEREIYEAELNKKFEEEMEKAYKDFYEE